MLMYRLWARRVGLEQKRCFAAIQRLMTMREAEPLRCHEMARVELVLLGNRDPSRGVVCYGLLDIARMCGSPLRHALAITPLPDTVPGMPPPPPPPPPSSQQAHRQPSADEMEEALTDTDLKNRFTWLRLCLSFARSSSSDVIADVVKSWPSDSPASVAWRTMTHNMHELGTRLESSEILGIYEDMAASLGGAAVA